MEVMTIDSVAFQSLTAQIADIAKFVQKANEALQAQTSQQALKPMLNSEEAARMLGISKRTLQRMRTENRIAFVMIGGQCRYHQHEIQKMIDERTIAKET